MLGVLHCIDFAFPSWFVRDYEKVSVHIRVRDEMALSHEKMGGRGDGRMLSSLKQKA